MAVRFNGSTTYLSNANWFPFDRDESFSIVIWVKYSSAHDGYLFSKNGSGDQGTHFYISSSSGRVQWGFANTWGSNYILFRTTANWADGNWHLFVLTYDGSSTLAGTNFYVDGVLITSYALSADNLTGSVTNGSTVYMGRFKGTSFAYNGDMDEPRVYDYELTEAEVQTLYGAQGKDGLAEDLRMRLPMRDDEPGQTVTSCADISGNGYDGAASNSPIYADGIMSISRY